MSESLRVAALDAAIRVWEHNHQRGNDPVGAAVVGLADQFYLFLNRSDPAVSMTLEVGPTTTQGDTSPMQIHDNEQFTLTVSEQDSKGQSVSDQLTWTSSDETVATVQVAADTMSATVVAGNPGSAVITVTDSASNLSATEAVDVVAGTAATISMAEGTAEPQPSAPADGSTGGDTSAPANPSL